MRKHIQIAAVIAVAGACVPALAQDSVSTLGALPGDALGPEDQQCEAFILDLSPIISTQGHLFGVGPILKTHHWDAGFFNNLPSSSAISPDLIENASYPQASYLHWDIPGGGINAETNSGGTQVFPGDQSSQFAVIQGNLGGAAGDNFNGVIGAVVNFDPQNANRLFVSYHNTALSRLNQADPNNSAIGGYSIDANGNAYYRADANGASSADALTGSNWYRTGLLSRNCGLTNVISNNLGENDATDVLVTNQSSLHPAPNMMPASIAGGLGLVGGVNFNGEYLYGSAAPLSSDTAYVDTSLAGSTRGKLSSTPADVLGVGGTHAQTYGQLAKGPGGRTTAFNLHAVDNTGARISKKAFEMPLTSPITDNDDGFAIDYSTSAPQFYNYTDAATFQGVGHIAMGVDQNGLGLMAATVMQNGTNDDFSNQIVVGRYNSSTGMTEWTFAAWVNQNLLGSPDGTMGQGKPIYDAGGVEIGQLVSLLPLTGGNPLGPYMSAPAMDSAGNIWFQGAIELYDRLGPGTSDYDGALLRAIYDPATFSYRLEVVLEVGQQIDGLNSGRKYRINFLGTATNNGTASPAAMWTNNASQTSWNNSDISGVDPSDPITNGGVVLSTSILYDVNDDGMFDITLGDEQYSVLMYVGFYQNQVADPCPAPPDYQDDNVIDIFDVFAFLNLFNASDPSADIQVDGIFDIFDVFGFVSLYNSGCP